MRHTTRLTGLLTTSVLLALGTAGAADAAPDRSSERVQAVLGSCGTGDDLLGDLTYRSAVATTASGATTVHLHATGTITRTGTGVTGAYSEKQRDLFGTDGGQTYSGVLSHLVVRGGQGLTLAGHAVITDESARVTPGLAPLMDLDFVAAVCGALS